MRALLLALLLGSTAQAAILTTRTGVLGLLAAPGSTGNQVLAPGTTGLWFQSTAGSGSTWQVDLCVDPTSGAEIWVPVYVDGATKLAIAAADGTLLVPDPPPGTLFRVTVTGFGAGVFGALYGSSVPQNP